MKKTALNVKKIALQCGLRLGDLSLAILLASLECGGTMVNNILDSSMHMGKVARQFSETRSIWDYLEEIRYYREHNIYVTIERLKKRGLIDPKRYMLTKQGARCARLLRGALKNHAARERQWDGKYRLVTFDIPEIMKKDRAWLRQKLMAHGFMRFQKSVFIGKFSIPEETYEDIVEKGLISYIRLLTVGDIDDGEALEQLDA